MVIVSKIKKRNVLPGAAVANLGPETEQRGNGPAKTEERQEAGQIYARGRWRALGKQFNFITT